MEKAYVKPDVLRSGKRGVVAKPPNLRGGVSFAHVTRTTDRFHVLSNVFLDECLRRIGVKKGNTTTLGLSSKARVNKDSSRVIVIVCCDNPGDQFRATCSGMNETSSVLVRGLAEWVSEILPGGLLVDSHAKDRQLMRLG